MIEANRRPGAADVAEDLSREGSDPHLHLHLPSAISLPSIGASGGRVSRSHAEHVSFRMALVLAFELAAGAGRSSDIDYALALCIVACQGAASASAGMHDPDVGAAANADAP